MQNKQEETRSERLGTMLTNSREFNLPNKYFLFLVFRFATIFIVTMQQRVHSQLVCILKLRIFCQNNTTASINEIKSISDVYDEMENY